jgi:hypothetical protein
MAKINFSLPTKEMEASFPKINKLTLLRKHPITEKITEIKEIKIHTFASLLHILSQISRQSFPSHYYSLKDKEGRIFDINNFGAISIDDFSRIIGCDFRELRALIV